MKKMIVCFLLLAMSVSSFSQHINSVPVLAKEDYLQKSKKQKTTAWILLGGGSALVLTGMIIPKGDVTHENFWGQKSYENDGIKDVFTLAGAICELGSIPFFISSSKNKKRAMRLSFKNEMMPQLQKNSFVFKTIPSLDLKISL